MALFLDFVAAKWYLFAAAGVLLVLLIRHENRKGAVSLTPAQLTALVNRESALVLDLRDPGEFRQGHIVESLNIPHGKFQERAGELERYRDRPVVVVCKMGQFSGSIAKTLKQQGFAHVYRLGGGILEWQAAQLPLVRS